MLCVGPAPEKPSSSVRATRSGRKRQQTKLNRKQEIRPASPEWKIPPPAPPRIFSCSPSHSRARLRLLKQLKPAIRAGSILIDATVALAAGVGGRASRTLGVWQGSSAQQAAELVSKGVSVVAAFHNLSAQILNGDESLDCDVIVCSDDPNATQLARALAAKIPGVRAIDGGKLENARILEQITALLIGLNIRHKGHGGIRVTGLPPEAYR